jgi:hypothetical protein
MSSDDELLRKRSQQVLEESRDIIEQAQAIRKVVEGHLSETDEFIAKMHDAQEMWNLKGLRATMDDYDVINSLIDYLNMQLNQSLEHISQESCKDKFFELFKEAPHLKPDAIRSKIVPRWDARTPGQDKEKDELLVEWASVWEEWRYVWRKLYAHRSQ